MRDQAFKPEISRQKHCSLCRVSDNCSTSVVLVRNVEDIRMPLFRYY
jgi:hypothetical protein